MNEALDHLRKLVAEKNWGYHPTGPQSTEPAAFASLALAAADMHSEATKLANWLASLQTATGTVGVTREQDSPAWPTSLAMLAWQACDLRAEEPRFAAARQLGLQWILETKGKTLPRQTHIGHDPTLLGWSWADATHSWLEPTCMFVLALKCYRMDEHPRTREAVRLIVDRQLESGGCNYGNTRVLGQETRPHVQPTGLAMLALSGEQNNDPRINRSLDYLEHHLNEETATASLCFALMGLAAHQRRPRNTESLLAHALKRSQEHNALSCYKLALLQLASIEDLSWLPQPESSAVLSALN